MSIFDQVNNGIKEAMKAKDAVALSANRAIKGEILLFKTAEGGAKEVTDGDILKMIQKLVKQRKEAAGEGQRDREHDDDGGLEGLELGHHDQGGQVGHHDFLGAA